MSLAQDGFQVVCVSPALGDEPHWNFWNLPNAWLEKSANACWQAVCFRALLHTCLLPGTSSQEKTGDQAHLCLVPNRNHTEKWMHSEICAWNTPEITHSE